MRSASSADVSSAGIDGKCGRTHGQRRLHVYERGSIYSGGAHDDAADSQAALLNWVSTSFTATLNGSPTFAADRGYTSNAFTTGVSTNFTPSTDGVQFTLDSAHFLAWSRTAGASANVGRDLGANGDTTGAALRTNGGNFNFAINDDAVSDTVANSDGSGCFVINRTASNVKQAFRNGAQIGSNFTTVSSTLGAGTLRIGGAASFGAAAAAREFAAGSVGAGLTAQNASDLYTALNTYMTAVGAA